MNESCHHEMSHMWMSVVPYIDESRTSLSQGIYYHVVSHLWMSHVTAKWLSHGWVMSHIYLRHVTCETSHERARRKAYIIMSLMNGPCRCKMSHTWMRHVPYIDESCPIYDWVMSPVKRARHQAQIITSCLPYEWVMSLQNVTHKDESCLIYRWVMSPVKRATNEPVAKQILSCHVSLMNKSCHCDISHPWMSHVPYIVGSCHWNCW